MDNVGEEEIISLILKMLANILMLFTVIFWKKMFCHVFVMLIINYLMDL